MLKRIDFEKGELVADGKTYKLATEMSINRFKALEALEIEFYYGFTMREMFEKLKASFLDLNKAKPADAAVKIHNIMKGVADRVDKREPVILRICSLFLNTEGEDVSEWSEELAKEKIDVWAKEGFLIDDFFTLAASTVPGFIKDYERILNDSLMTENEQGKEEERPSQENDPSKKK
jgi:hypothetical protein